MENHIKSSKSNLLKKMGKSSLIIFIAFLMLACLHCAMPGSDTDNEKEQGIFLNVPADALMNHTRWGADIDSISKEQAIAALEEYVLQYANTQVNRLLFNVNYLRACYDSKIMTPYWDVPDPSVNTSEWCRKYWQVNKKGIDVFEVCVAKSREMGTSPWLSFRMNDHHYRDNPNRLSTFMLDHPEFRISPTSSFDYANSEVREFYKSFIREALERYDVDGVELDWMRTHIVFKPGMESQGIEIMNNFMIEIRAIVEQNSSERGHPIEIAARVPSTPAIGRSFGLDGVAWARDQSVDIIIPSNFFRPTNFDIPVELWKSEIGNEVSCMIVPGADAAFRSFRNKSRDMVNSIETMRAFAISAYHRGAGSVYLFNNHSFTFEKKIVNPDGSTEKVNDKPVIIREGGKLSTIIGKPRRHVLTFTNPDIKRVSNDAPVLKKNDITEYMMYTGPKPSNGNYIVRIALELLPGYNSADFGVMVNDKPCTQIDDMPVDTAFKYENANDTGATRNVSEMGARVMQFRADLKAVNDGYNSIKIVNNKEEEQEVNWLEIYID